MAERREEDGIEQIYIAFYFLSNLCESESVVWVTNE